MSRAFVPLRDAAAVAVAAFCLHAAAWAAPIGTSGAAATWLQRGPGSAGVLPTASRDSAAVQARMRRCLQDWSPATQMSKREWRASCQRVIIQQPGFFKRNPL